MSLLKTVLVFLFAANIANASTVTLGFNHQNATSNGDGTETASEQGFSYDFSYTYLSGSHIYFHDDSGILSSTISPTSPTTFSLTSVDIYGYSNVNQTGSGPAPADPYSSAYNTWATAGSPLLPSLTFSGMSNGVEVASQSFGPMAWTTMAFSSAFTNLDSLIVSLNIPNALSYVDPTYGGVGSDTAWCYEWCAGFQIDNLVLTTSSVLVAPVPLPASALLLLTGLFGLATTRKLRKARSEMRT